MERKVKGMAKDGNASGKSAGSNPQWTVPSIPIDSTELRVNLEQIRQKTGNSGDIIIREFTIGARRRSFKPQLFMWMALLTIQPLINLSWKSC